eukprot:TRINITY_DN122758_c0_g1_i1.p1 TRINITY_DN122758_c0_g1~~TRINITY_DN122758_c0_g1_i1.p1  ORF type:complete len:718 (-),score=143.11 TRINITY_DN122758_c0_g1_i1:165-2318(-)
MQFLRPEAVSEPPQPVGRSLTPIRRKWRGRYVALLGLLELTSSAGGQECLPCNPNDFPLPAPGQSVLTHNGMQWPSFCVPKTPEGEEEHVFLIGDWGGFGPWATTFDNTWGKREYVWGVDDKAQHLVANLMSEMAEKYKPRYIINVGDNFYPAGVFGACGEVDMCSFLQTGQWEAMWQNVYNSDELKDLEWWGVLGNHDFGGYSFGRPWEQAVAFTWHSDRWITPAMYWRRTATYCDFDIDYFFLDTNTYDAEDPATDKFHNICSWEANAHADCSEIGGPTSAYNCVDWFKRLFDDQLKWLEHQLSQSTATWQIIVTHFPPQYGSEVWLDVAKRFGVDIFLTGHRHMQELHFNGHGGMCEDLSDGCGWMRLNMSQTAWVVSGGGGGVTSEGDPRTESDVVQMYGFVDLTVSKETIQIDMWSGVTKQMKRRVTVHPVKPSSQRRLEARRQQALRGTDPDPVGSCAKYGCTGTVFQPGHRCQCTVDCHEFETCCEDHATMCWKQRHEWYAQRVGERRAQQLNRTSPPSPEAEERRLDWKPQPEAAWEIFPRQHLKEEDLPESERCSATRRRTSVLLGKHMPKEWLHHAPPRITADSQPHTEEVTDDGTATPAGGAAPGGFEPPADGHDIAEDLATISDSNGGRGGGGVGVQGQRVNKAEFLGVPLIAWASVCGGVGATALLLGAISMGLCRSGRRRLDTSELEISEGDESEDDGESLLG